MADAPQGPEDTDAAKAGADAARPPKRGFLRRRWLGVSIATLIGVPIFVFTVWAGVALEFSYSEGTRTGFVQKLSKKGWICKTWEGEMAMTAQPGVAPVLFSFTVRLDSIADEITRLEGKQVTLWYEEHRGVPSSCFGETGHFVDRVSAVTR
jgi:hypothetical protein